MNGVLDALNQLGSTPWRVNTDVLDLMLRVFRTTTQHVAIGGDDEAYWHEVAGITNIPIVSSRASGI